MNIVGFEPAPLADTNHLARPELRRTDHSTIHFYKNESFRQRTFRYQIFCISPSSVNLYIFYMIMIIIITVIIIVIITYSRWPYLAFILSKPSPSSSSFSSGAAPPIAEAPLLSVCLHSFD
ncbi:hypothetical protein ElyMa_004557600 [Elysia marginata]|uniref:Uncharacterized protein n=1 Tax=Elysia marginata TaxID=1093978 RepID=A0AAV4HV45_9GAST|nr:hypothetical protein ElyMa_004557600 [Elysia marginata]